MSQTICPACGHSPIPAGAEECPVCNEPFAFLPMHKKAKKKFIDKNDAEESESTSFGGGLTGEVSAHPYQAATVLFGGALIWFLRGSGVLTGVGDASWLYAIVAADLLVALLLIINLGPAKMLAQLVLLLQLGAALYLGRDNLLQPVHLMFAAHAGVGLFITAGEPGGVRRTVGLIAGLLVCSLAAVLLVIQPGNVVAAGPRQKLSAAGAGFSLLLPPDYSSAKPLELTRHLKVPQPSLNGTTAGFSSTVERTIGLILVNRDGSAQLIGSCQTLHQDLGGTNVPNPIAHRAPRALGDAVAVFELRTFSGASGLLACGKLADGRFVALVVLSINPDPSSGARAFDAVGEGLSLQ